MGENSLSQSQDITVFIDGDVSIGNSESIKGEMMTALSQGKTVQVDCHSATVTDIAFVQLLLAARLTAERRGCALHVIPPNDGSLREIARRSGVISETDALGTSFWG